jgi:phosphoesterase RecJ-like protein
LGLARILRQIGKGATVWNRDPVPKTYQPLAGSSLIHVGAEPPAGFPEHYSGVILLECPSPGRCGLFDAFSGLEILNIDHHLGNEQYGVVNWVDTTAPAVGEMVFRLAQTLNLDLDEKTANALYLTLVTDTGGFRYSNTTPETFQAAAALMSAGASPVTVSQWLYESQPESAIRLLGTVLDSLQMHHDGRVATVWLTQDMVQRCGAQPGDSEGLIDTPRSIAGVEAVALLRELDGGGFKVSLRSSGITNVEKIARSYGGGGHHNAAGFSHDGDRQALFDAVVEALGKDLE